MSNPTPTSPSGRQLVIVSGSGRSGTSTAAGTLKKLGLLVPPPEVQPDNTNPRGFFEPRWVVDFHKRWLAKAGVRTLDARPEAAARVATLSQRPRPRRELATWLSDQFSSPQLVVKDPRAFWFSNLWLEAAGSVGARMSYLTMLRHPAEVIGSRGVHYLSDLEEAQLRERETALLAGWVNVVLVNERATRGHPRVFVPYPSLLKDWRGVMSEVALRLDLTLEGLDPAQHHPVDDFIDASLHRVRVSWGDLSVPPHLQELAERTWRALTALVDEPEDSAATATLDACRRDYDVMHSHAVALARHATESEISRVRRELRREQRHAGAEPGRATTAVATRTPRAHLPQRASRALVSRLGFGRGRRREGQ